MNDPNRPTPETGSIIPHLLLMIMTLGLAIWAARWGVAGVYTIPADHVLAAWQDAKHPQPPDNQRWEQALSYLQQASELEPGQAEHHFRLAHMQHLRALDLHPWHPQYAKHLQQAKSHYQQALKQRPTWGYGWINLAQIDIQADQTSPETIHAWRRGLQLAPTSSPVQHTGLRLGFALWEQLQPDDRQKVLQIAQKLLPEQGEYVLTQAKLYGYLPLMRPLVDPFPHWQSRWKKYEQNKENIRG